MVMETRYNPTLVALSVLVAIFASYVALNLSHSVTQAKGRAQIVWLTCGALAMGVGIWSMHFVGMLAFEMPGMEMGYDVPLMILSVLVAIGASALALLIVSRPVAVSMVSLIFGGVAMAAAIAGMHYIGMYSMRMAASIRWNVYLVALSVVIALVASFAALFISRRLRNKSDHLLQLTLASTVMGFAISGMHYTGMVAATFIHKEGPAISEQNLLVSSGLAIAVIVTTLLILGLALAGSVGQRIWARQQQRANDLSKSEARKAAILNASLEAIITIDHAGNVLEWNVTAEKTFGFSSVEAIGRELAGLIIPQRFRKAHSEGLARYLTTGKGPVIGKRIEMPALRANGEEFPLELSIGVIPGGNGPPMFTASARDITDRVRAAEALKKNEEKFRCVIEAAPNGLLMVEEGGKIVLCNRQFEVLFGYDRTEIVGREMEFLVPAKYRHNHPSYRAGFFKTPIARQMGAGRDLYGLRKDGTEFPVEIGLNPLVTDEGAFVLASIVDITKRKTLEDRIRHSANHIQQKNLEMEQFVYTVSHDLKSPLVTSAGFLGLLKEDIVAKRYDKIADSIGRLERANLRMNQLIDDLLQLSRVGRIKLEVEKVDISSLVKTICENLSAQIREKSVIVNVLDDIPAVRGDPQRIYQVFENLIINALKYGADVLNPKITIGSESAEGEVRLFVRDNGPGIAEEYHKKIFGLFQRLESDNRGTGVGLTIVSRIMQLHAGRVWVESDVGSGATFWLAFPKTFVAQGEAEYD